MFVASGLWHGAGFSFLIWGFYHALLVLLYHFTSRWWDFFPLWSRIAVTFVLVSLGWPLFDIGARGYFNLVSVLSLSAPPSGIFGLQESLYLAGLMFVIFCVREDRFVYSRSPWGFLESPVTQALTLTTCLIFINFSKTFIYFRF